MKLLIAALRRLARMLVVVALVVFGTTVLVRFGPGYLSDAREMDPRYSFAARSELSVEAAHSASILQMLRGNLILWMNGDLGRSRQYDIPVLELIKPRLASTGSLVLRSVVFAWNIAWIAALAATIPRNPALVARWFVSLVLAMPTAALATLCLMADTGGPGAGNDPRSRGP